MAKLTTQQQNILDVIQEVIAETGMPPTRAEIARHLGFRSANAAEDHLRALARKGMIELLPGAARGIRITDPPGLPVVGRVAAGSPLLAQEHIEARYRLDPRLFHPKPHFLLRVRGMSMRDAGIFDGDLLAIHRSPEVRSGQIVVARLGDEVTVKRYRLRGSQVWLEPANPDFQPILVEGGASGLVLEGVVVGVIRNGTPASIPT
ncbi:MAG: transcriptional repressor LexA [Gammaproteobacteria bacterium]|nr:transcriptional repressor LexA [Gammaproteobacteria bacterium]MBU6509194.1 transcriptional repressor LexA [Gammaproteobacteria bacterium]MDE1984086.1 transcriptional repressor LexA [Gammaproteobacteria bacterium]MDE2108607.1 transcriptional repressor LexA [Gammaproteobacteria bacterium]MDE2460707.1 transcriptional repressor LexA [Gammaproteobacteria bacterium]